MENVNIVDSKDNDFKVKQRVLSEYKDLIERRVKLERVLKSDGYPGIDNKQIEILKKQLEAMKLYEECLFDRIVLMLVK